ncbi:NO-inducible flavohemoprotein [Vibrio mexicanus]|uniref:NO-inducible flavohemoprotein n=1 Tax=Vibrio mexicanus TaxID=1004326 RepID=UPI00063C2CF8|nr:NO-inducible flavohemoprotein [Vibrio mexicanus]
MLSSKTIDTVKATAPLLAQTGPKLTEHFYTRLFTHHPELKDVFNMSHQRESQQSSGAQREALFNAICAYAGNIDNLEALLPAVEKIAQKHSSFLITAEQYAVVGEHLLATIDELFSPGQEVLDAWGEAYGLLANIFIQREESIYQNSEALDGGWRGLREFELIEKTKESASITSFVFKPTDAQSVASFKPGQYIGIYINDDSFENQEIRQYSLSSAPKTDTYRISVKREEGGTVSNYLHNQLTVGDKVKLAPPAGDFFMDVDKKTPVALISAGVGLTPTLSMLETLTHHEAGIHWIHATDNGQQHAFQSNVKALAESNSNISINTWYKSPLDDDQPAEDYQFSGLLDLSKIAHQIDSNLTQAYICGPVGFMQLAAKQLIELGFAEEQIHYECFGPHKVL